MNLFASNNQNRPTAPLFTSPATNPTQTQPTNQPAQQSQPTNTNQPQMNPQTANNVTVPPTRPVQQGNNPNQRDKQRSIKFKQIYKLLQHDPQSVKNLQKSPEIRRALGQSLQYFDITAEKTQQYERQHSKKINFGFGVQELSEQCRNLNTEKIDNFWKVIIENMSEICQTSQLIIAQYLSQFLIEQQLYIKKITTKQFYYGSYNRVLNPNFIQTLYRTNYETGELVISTQSQFYLQIFQYLLNQIYSQHAAMLKILQFFQKKSKRYFRQVIKKQSCDLFTVLWKKYRQFSQSGIKQQSTGPDQLPKKIKEFFTNNKKYEIEKKVRKYKISIAMHVGVVLFQVLDQYGSWRKQPYISSLIDYKEAVMFVDGDLEVLVKEIAELPVREYRYVSVALDLLLKIVPICSLCRSEQIRVSNLSVRQIQQLRTILTNTKSPYLSPFRFLTTTTSTSPSLNPNLPTLQSQYQKIPKTVQWMMQSDQWSEWLGLILNACENSREIVNCQQFLKQVVKMMKNVVELNVEEFWAERCEYYLRFIREFLVGCVGGREVRWFLGVFTKCLGNQVKKLQYATLTLQLLGFDAIKKIHTTITQTLDLQTSSSLTHSILLSQSQSPNPSQSYLNPSPQQIQPKKSTQYPEQQIKFICKLIKNCKEDLSVVESALFQCEREYSTGVLACLFLLECLAVVGDYKPGALKCMRYIMDAVDALFCYQQTRAPMTIAISLNLCQQWGQKSKNQLYQMISYICLKPSASQQHRQCQKLKKVISNHLCNIVRISKYISEYFPVREDSITENQFVKLHTHIVQKNYPGVYQWFYGNGNGNGNGLVQPTPWFYTLLLCLQGRFLVPIDYQCVRLLLMKFLVDKEWSQQTLCLTSITQILNQSTLTQNLLSILQPTLNSSKNSSTGQNLFLFGLCNLKYQQLMQNNVNVGSSAMYREDQPYFKVKEKEIKSFRQDRDVVVGNLAGCLEVVAAVLAIGNRIGGQGGGEGGGFGELILGLNLYQDINKLIGDKATLHQYKVPLSHSQPAPHPQQQPLSNLVPTLQQSPPSLSINILQVISSYLNFQSHYNLPQTHAHSNKTYNTELTILGPVSSLTNTNQQTIIDYSINGNVLGLDGNQLMMRSDYGIGVGAVLRILGQVVVGKGGKGGKGGAGFLYRCLVFHDFRMVNQEGFGAVCCLEDFGMFVRELVRMLQWVQLPHQIQSIFQFLTLSINQSQHFLQQLLQSNTLPTLRKLIKIQLSTSPPQHKLQQYNKISLFALALSEYRDQYPEEVEMFVKFPSNFVQDVLEGLGQLGGFVEMCGNGGDGEGGEEEEDVGGLMGYVRGFRRIGYVILFKGTLHICIQLLKRFYPIQSMTQNIQTIQTLLTLSHNLPQIPTPPQTEYLSLFKQSPKNKLILHTHHHTHTHPNPNPNPHSQSQICIAVPQLTLKYENKYKCLSKFVGFLPTVGQQYGRNYLYYGAEIFGKVLYGRFRGKHQAEKILLNVYKINYQASLVVCHQQMLIAFISFILMVNTTGQFGHLLSMTQQDRLLTKHPKITPTPIQPIPAPSTALPQILTLQKQPSPSPLQGSLLYGHSISQCHESQLSLLSIFIQYFQKDHSKQYINDLLIYVISSLIVNLRQFCFVGGRFLGEFRRMLGFVLDGTRVRFRVSPAVFGGFLGAVVEGLACCGVGREGAWDCLEQVAEIVQAIVLYGGTLLTAHNTKFQSLQLIFTQKSLQQNIFQICNILTTLLTLHPSPPSPPSHKHILSLTTTLSHTILTNYLTNPQILDLNSMCIIKLLNTLLTDGWYQIRMLCRQEEEEGLGQGGVGVGEEVRKGLSQIGNLYGKFLVRGLKMGGCEEWACFMLAGLRVVHQFGMDGDVGCWETVMDFMAYQFNQQSVQVMQNSYQDAQNYSKPNRDHPTLRKQKLPVHPPHPNNTSFFPQILTSTQCSTLSKIIQLNQLLQVLSSITQQQLYWTNRKYSTIVQSIFNCLINQSFLYKLTQTSSRPSTRLLQTRIPVEKVWEENLEKVGVEEVANVYQWEDGDKKEKKDGKKTSLFQFVVHLEVSHAIYYFVEVLEECLDRSESLRRFYSKMLNNKLNFIDELVWEKIANTFLCILEYMKQKTVSFIRYYPKSLKQLLTLHNYLRHSTDISHNSNYLSIFLQNSGIPQTSPSPNFPQHYKTFILDLSLLLTNCIIKFIQIWKAYDWKSNYNWAEVRKKLVNQAYAYWRECCGYVMTQGYLGEEGENLGKVEKWFGDNMGVMMGMMGMATR